MGEGMKKLLKCLVIVGVVIGCLGGYVLYQTYETVVKPIDIEKVVDDIVSDEDYVEFEQIQPVFLDAVVAIEDKRFYDHQGVELQSIFRALLKNIEAQEIVQGGSTITQQVAKNIFLSHDQTLLRKVSEMFLAWELESLYTKEELLSLYVNVIYYGDGHTGILEASQGYFDVLPSELTYDQATLLAGLPQAPSAYALSQNYERAKLRQEQVISALELFQVD